MDHEGMDSALSSIVEKLGGDNSLEDYLLLHLKRDFNILCLLLIVVLVL
jgi:hypothetical protein